MFFQRGQQIFIHPHFCILAFGISFPNPWILFFNCYNCITKNQYFERKYIFHGQNVCLHDTKSMYGVYCIGFIVQLYSCLFSFHSINFFLISVIKRGAVFKELLPPVTSLVMCFLVNWLLDHTQHLGWAEIFSQLLWRLF